MKRIVETLLLGAPGMKKPTVLLFLTVCLLTGQASLWGATTGSISGTIKDPTDAIVPDVAVTATNPATGVVAKTTTDKQGFYSFPSLVVGHYDILAAKAGFKDQHKKGITVDLDSALQIDLALELAQNQQELTVAETAADVTVETASTQMGDVVAGNTMTEVALNGRSFTDLLALQPGIVPMSTQTGDSVIMAGASVQIAPSGGLNAGNQSISGQREDANGYLVNGGDVKELMNGGTTIIPNLDSIAEFRVLTNNFDAEYGNYSGGIVNVITKSGANANTRHRLRISAEHRSRRPQLLLPGAQFLSPEPVWRHGWRPDPQE